MTLESRRCLAALALVVVTMLTGCTEAEAGADPTAAVLESSTLRASLQDHLDSLHAAGITGLLAEVQLGHHHLHARSGVARLEGSGAVPWNARFRMGSVTKTFVAVVVLQLVGEGRLSLEDSVEKWLPGVVVGNGYDATRITVRNLLQHTSGIFNYTNDVFATMTAEIFQATRLHHYEPEDLVAMALQHPPDFAPGASWSYSNTNYILAGMIIERVTGRPWPVEVRRRIVRPLGLSDTLEPGDDPDLHGPHAHAYQQFSDDGPFIDATRLNHTVAGAAGSLVTTTEDLSTFLRALQQGRLLRPAEMAEMHRTVPATELEPVMPGLRYGLGLMQFPGSCGEPYWSHFGDTMGFSTRDAVSADGNRTVVVSLTASLSGEATLGILAEDLALLDDVMCDGQD